VITTQKIAQAPSRQARRSPQQSLPGNSRGESMNADRAVTKNSIATDLL
jgi:hypothetical protein